MSRLDPLDLTQTGSFSAWVYGSKSVITLPQRMRLESPGPSLVFFLPCPWIGIIDLEKRPHKNTQSILSRPHRSLVLQRLKLIFRHFPIYLDWLRIASYAINLSVLLAWNILRSFMSQWLGLEQETCAPTRNCVIVTLLFEWLSRVKVLVTPDDSVFVLYPFFLVLG